MSQQGRGQKLQMARVALLGFCLIGGTFLVYSSGSLDSVPASDSGENSHGSESFPARSGFEKSLVLVPVLGEEGEEARLRLAHAYRPGRILRYHLSSRVAMQTTGGTEFADFGSGQPLSESPMQGTMEIAVEADLVLSVYEKRSSGDGWWIGFRLEEVRLDLDGAEGEGVQESIEQLSSDLEQTVLAEVTTSGKIEALTFDRGTKVRGRNMVRSLLAGVQFQLPDQSGLEWTAEEEDATGSYQATYVIVDQHQRGEEVLARIQKVKQYENMLTSASGAGGALPRPDLEGETVGYFNIALGRLEGIFQAEEMTIEGPGLPLTYQAAILFSLVLTASADREALGRSELTTVRRLRTQGLRSVGFRPEEFVESGREEVLARIEDKEGLLDRVHQVLTEKGKLKRFSPEMRELVESLGKDEALVQQVADLIQSGEPTTRNTLIDALAASGTPACQKVLTDFVADSETESSVRLRSIWGLGSAVRPISEAVDVLDEASRDSSPGVSRKSMEVLGMVANRLDQQGSRVSVQRAVRILGNRLEASPNAGMKQSALIGLGNSGSSYALPRVAGYLKSPNPDLRSAAVMALRKMEVSRAFELTRNLMRNDLSPAVRRAAVDSMAQREGSPEARKEIDRVVLQDSNESTRRAALDAILLRDEIGEEERKILEQVADKDSSEELRRIARQELSKK